MSLRRWSIVVVVLLAGSALSRDIVLRTSDGKTVSGAVVMEGDRGVLVRTEAGNVLVPWADIIESRDESARPVAPVREESTKGTSALSIGVAAGAGGGTVFGRPDESEDDKLWVPIRVALLLHVNLGRVALRFTLPHLEAGPRVGGASRMYFQFAGGLSAEFRLNFSDRFSSGVGIQAGGLFFTARNVKGLNGYPFVGPSLTLFAVRLGEQRNRELSLNAQLQVSIVPDAPALPTYAGLGVQFAQLF